MKRFIKCIFLCKFAFLFTITTLPLISLHQIKALASEHYSMVLSYRRAIHENPELSFEEHQTSDFVSAKLTEMGIPNYKMANTGVVGILEGKTKVGERSRTIALRADLDALPIEEHNEVPYKSKNKGIMHACGHDVHTASLLGAAKILNNLKEEWNGTVKLIFQPGEEKLPGGASILINEGVLENPSPEAIIAQHVFPSLESGKAGFLAGSYMASCDEIYLKIKGKGGHAAMSSASASMSVNEGTAIINPILIASEILLTLENIFMSSDNHQIINPEVKRKRILQGKSSTLKLSASAYFRANHQINTVLAFGKMVANGATNVIPDEVNIEGTFRTMDEEWRKKAHKIIKQTIEEITQKWGGQCEIRIEKGYPVLINNEEVTNKARQAAEEYLGKENVVTLEKRMTSEDFSYYSLKKPSCFYRLGTGNAVKGITSGVHTSTFNIDEKALETAMGLMAWIALNELLS